MENELLIYRNKKRKQDAMLNSNNVPTAPTEDQHDNYLAQDDRDRPFSFQELDEGQEQPSDYETEETRGEAYEGQFSEYETPEFLEEKERGGNRIERVESEGQVSEYETPEFLEEKERGNRIEREESEGRFSEYETPVFLEEKERGGNRSDREESEEQPLEYKKRDLQVGKNRGGYADAEKKNEAFVDKERDGQANKDEGKDMRPIARLKRAHERAEARQTDQKPLGKRVEAPTPFGVTGLSKGQFRPTEPKTTTRKSDFPKTSDPGLAYKKWPQNIGKANFTEVSKSLVRGTEEPPSLSGNPARNAAMLVGTIHYSEERRFAGASKMGRSAIHDIAEGNSSADKFADIFPMAQKGGAQSYKKMLNGKVQPSKEQSRILANMSASSDDEDGNSFPAQFEKQNAKRMKLAEAKPAQKKPPDPKPEEKKYGRKR